MGQLQLHFSNFCLWAQGYSVLVVPSTSPRIQHMLHNTQQK